MHKTKQKDNSRPSGSSSSATTGTNLTLHALQADTARETAKYLPLNEIAKLARISKSNHKLFQPMLNEAKAVHPFLTAVVQGNPDELARLVQNNPELLFKKGRIKDPAGQIFYDVSPYQLITFLCDDDMKAQIMPLVSPMTEQMTCLRQEQYAEIDRGGADLIKMDRDPTLLAFEEVTRFITSYTVMNQATSVTFPLLENTDGIIFYKEATTGLEYLYYANKETQKVELIEPKAHSKNEHQALDKLYASFAAMENNSSRRSSNAEHELIEHTTHHKLSRKGIQYERDGVRYCDNRMDFGLLNAYRKCVRLYQEQQWGAGDESWRRGVGQAQRGVMWLLQRICEEGRPFYPLPDFKSAPFKRGLNIYNFVSGRAESLGVSGILSTGVGSDFAVLKAGGGATAPRGWWRVESWAAVDLVAVHRLIEDAKANVVEFTPGLDRNAHNAESNRRLSPG